MGELMKFCPECGASMAVRLGENQCTSCTFVAPAVTEAPEPRGPASGPGLPKTAKPLHSAGDLPGITPAKASSGTGFGTPEGMGPQRHGPGPGLIKPPPEAAPAAPAGYIPGGIAPSDLYGVDVRYQPRKDSGGPLLVEKNIYFGITAVLMGLNVLMYLFLALAGPGVAQQMQSPVSPVALFFIALISAAIGLGVLYWVLYDDAVWAKYACAGCNVLSLALLVFGSFWLIGTLPLYMAQLDTLSAGMLNTFAWVGIIISLGWQGWFVSILVRDTQLQRG